MKLEFSKWYVVDVSFGETNPVHRAICKGTGTSTVELYGSYENPIIINKNKLHVFKVITPIKEMNER